ncbi:hypothetical protein GTGU_03559 [Trabulsiella guamensis ATCC 49490]|uniref:Inner membrane protein n=1 Tax=Trabulsiella guamensis ATCC 49490 TaxID=1005994 RepID=A0A084ZU97_9ENTR|nr:YbjC family protein [Trabulsiella guamensis]KFC01042.1 hypothetical protein GTGU_03559 [Trabulsiella guamensis ATCC 49490]
MKSLGALPKSVLILEAAGMILLALAWLSLNQYIRLPAPFTSQIAAVVMIFVGIFLMLPAAFALFWKLAQGIAPQLMQGDKTSSYSDRKKRDDADH